MTAAESTGYTDTGWVSGAHFNPAVSLVFALRGVFPWRRFPGYVVAQVVGACLAALLLMTIVRVLSTNGGSYPGESTTDWAAFAPEIARPEDK